MSGTPFKYGFFQQSVGLLIVDKRIVNIFYERIYVIAHHFYMIPFVQNVLLIEDSPGL